MSILNPNLEMPKTSADGVAHSASPDGEPVHMNPSVIRRVEGGVQDSAGNTLLTDSMVLSNELVADPKELVKEGQTMVVVDQGGGGAADPLVKTPRIMSNDARIMDQPYFNKVVPLPSDVLVTDRSGDPLRGTLHRYEEQPPPVSPAGLPAPAIVRSPPIAARQQEPPAVLEKRLAIAGLEWLGQEPKNPGVDVVFNRPGLIFMRMKFHDVQVGEKTIALLFDTRSNGAVNLPAPPAPGTAVQIECTVYDQTYQSLHLGAAHEFGPLLLLILMRLPEDQPSEGVDPFAAG